jgi:hypothetical protein
MAILMFRRTTPILQGIALTRTKDNGHVTCTLYANLSNYGFITNKVYYGQGFSFGPKHRAIKRC